MSVWTAVGATAVGCYLAKLLGLCVPEGFLERPLVKRLAALLPVALLAARTAQQTSAGGSALVADARGRGSRPRPWRCSWERPFRWSSAWRCW
jgi:hypothetical protein